VAPPSQGAPSSSNQRFGKYELLSLLATGGTAEIHLARLAGEAGFEKIVVIKRLLPTLIDDTEFTQMFLDEARLGARLAHGNIVSTLELGQVNGRYFIAMEYLAGMSLAQLMVGVGKQRMTLPADLALAMMAQGAAGLHYAHECKTPEGKEMRIVHRDVSPQNLIVSFDGLVKVVDFGIAHADASFREARTKAGMVKGKFAYMAPEQCSGKAVDRRTDVFALGVVVHEMLTGRRLFKRKSTYETYTAIMSGVYPKPSQVAPGLEPGLDDLIMPAIAFSPDERYSTAEAFGEAMLNYLFAKGKRVGNRDIKAYIAKYFAPEIKEHDDRMSRILRGETEVGGTGRWDALPDDLIVVELQEATPSAIDLESMDVKIEPDDLAPKADEQETHALKRAPTVSERGVPKLALPLPAPPTEAVAPKVQLPRSSDPGVVFTSYPDELTRVPAPAEAAEVKISTEPVPRQKKGTSWVWLVLVLLLALGLIGAGVVMFLLHGRWPR
jgi:serine/threonine-protein kinase